MLVLLQNLKTALRDVIVVLSKNKSVLLLQRQIW